ncbi:PDGLE domain-containing protein [Blastococcus xanthinilyticus]|uniref:Cobalt/nickel transport protein n=1 Tax=Blastococcus xanthinilyticus TaxID=1564164 RepID=A0A5S5CQA8_9ACTN|nr:PDGLE domain-containing protein [Blastococcus xanthinilyticus]TYP86021.1 cobalt/nickel transport protein [Blastococcus xanthinilyticus]
MTRRGRTLWLAGLVAALLVAGFLSWYASGSPDGLEHAAEEAGFAHTAEDSVTAGSPLADYLVDGEENRLSAGAAGVIGVVVTLALAGGLTLVLRRRGSSADRS